MEANLTAIGNSRGVRIPAKLIKHYGFEGAVELVMHEEGILLKAKPSANMQQIWEQQAQAMQAQNIGLLDDDLQGWAEIDIGVGIE